MSHARHPVMDLTRAGEELTEMQSIRLALSNYPCRRNTATKSRSAVISDTFLLTPLLFRISG